MRKVLLIAIFIFSHVGLFAADPLISVFSTPEEVGEASARKIADIIIERQKEGKKAVLGLATGSTVIPVYTALKKLVRENHMDLSHVITFNLDEYIGLPTSHEQSYHSFMFFHLFNDLLSSADNPNGIKLENIHIPQGEAEMLQDLSIQERASLIQHFLQRKDPSLTKEEQLWIAKRRAQEYEKLIESLGPIDLQLLGIGRNGHIGFAEPGSSFTTRTMTVKLSETTRQDNARFFDDDLKAVPDSAITMGIATILQAKEILLLATGEHKAEIIAKTLTESISTEIPSTALRLHGKVSIFLDEKAAVFLKSKITRFHNARLLLDHQIKEGDLWICDGKIISQQKQADIEIDVQKALLAPGYIDLQVNGCFGCDFSRNAEKIDQVAKLLPRYGITSFLPTIVSSSPEQYRSLLPLLQPRSFQNKGAAILGIHLEGPFFAKTYSGCHNKEHLRPIYDENNSIEKVYGNLQGVKIVTLAPEIPGALELIEHLKKNNIVVSAGHSAATFEQMQAGIKAGIGFVTHLFNAMPAFHHRNPSIVGSALLNPSIPYSIIVDGVHLCPETIALCWRCNPDGLILVSDCVEALGLSSGKYQLGTMDVEVNNGHVYLAGTETIAGSILRLDQAVRNLHKTTQCSIVQALEAASLKPARLIDVYPSKGTLEVGADADFLILTDDLQVKAVYIGGELYDENLVDQPNLSRINFASL